MLNGRIWAIFALIFTVSVSAAHAQYTFRGNLTSSATAPACSDQIVTIPTSGNDVLKSPGCPTVVKLSQYGVTSDTGPLNVETPSPIGTDQTAAIQAVLDLNKASCTSVTTVPSVCDPLTVIVDVRATVTALTVNSNTHVVCLPGDGFLLKAAGPGPILRNSNKSFGTATGTQYYTSLGSFGNTDISVEGCDFNEQRANQTLNPFPSKTIYTNGTPAAVMMYGVQNYRLIDNRSYSSIWHSFISADVTNFTAKDNLCDASPFSAGGGAGVAPGTPGSTTDCIHMNGPMANFHVDNTHAHTGDDPIAINADDGDGDPTIIGNWYADTGDITDGDVSNTHLFVGLDGTQPQHGINFLSSHALINNVTVNGIYGVTNGVAVSMSTQSTQVPIAGNGNMGTIVLNGPGPLVQGAGDLNTYFGDIDTEIVGKNLTIRNWYRRPPTINRAFIRLGGSSGGWSVVHAQNIYQAEFTADSGNHYAVPAIEVSSTMGDLIVTNSDSQSNITPLVSRPLVSITSAVGTIETLEIDNTNSQGIGCLVNVAGGTISMMRWSGINAGAGGDAAVCNAGTVSYLTDTGSMFAPVGGFGYSGTAPAHYNSGAP